MNIIISEMLDIGSFSNSKLILCKFLSSHERQYVPDVTKKYTIPMKTVKILTYTYC